MPFPSQSSSAEPSAAIELSPSQTQARKDLADHAARLSAKLQYLKVVSQKRNPLRPVADPVRFEFPGGQTLTVAPGLIHSSLRNQDASSHEEVEYNAAIYGFEALVLALATAGVDMGAPRIRLAIQTAVESISQRFD